MPQEVRKVGDTMAPMEMNAKFYKLAITNSDGSPYMTLYVAGDKARKVKHMYSFEEGFLVDAEAMDQLPEGVELDIA
jgi:hypothetical protein